jgi:hypothetical protein
MLDKTSFVKSKGSYNKRTPGQYQFNPPIFSNYRNPKRHAAYKKRQHRTMNGTNYGSADSEQVKIIVDDPMFQKINLSKLNKILHLCCKKQ